MAGEEEPAIPALRSQFQDLVDRHYAGLWSYVSFLTFGAAASEDILHEAFLAAFDRLAAGKEFTGDPGLWLRGTIRNLVRVWWREKRKAPQELTDRLVLLAEEADDPSAAASRAEIQAALVHCLGKLAEADRRLVEKRYADGLRITRIAEELGRNVATVRVQLFRVRQSLMRCVQARLHGGPALAEEG